MCLVVIEYTVVVVVVVVIGDPPPPRVWLADCHFRFRRLSLVLATNGEGEASVHRTESLTTSNGTSLASPAAIEHSQHP